MKLADLRRSAREGIAPGAGVADIIAPDDDDEGPLFREEVQAIWEQIQGIALSFAGAGIVPQVLGEIKGKLIHVLIRAHDEGTMAHIERSAIESLCVEHDGEGVIDVVWPAQVKIFFEEEAERWRKGERR